MSYYGEYPDEVDRFIAANEHEAEQRERALENERRLRCLSSKIRVERASERPDR